MLFLLMAFGKNATMNPRSMSDGIELIGMSSDWILIVSENSVTQWASNGWIKNNA
jgi:hypothetical protein